LALLACNDDRGRQVLEACRCNQIQVPDDVAVLGIDNDEVFCELSNPPLSSVAFNAEKAGFRAAKLLDELMQGKSKKPQHIAMRTVGVVPRRSTDVFAVKDELVVAAVEYIRRKEGVEISVDTVANDLAVSRRSLERRFGAKMGRTILEEIQLARLARAQRLLAETGHSISKVARLSGFQSISYFGNFFQKRVGKSPRRYRIEVSKQ
jgi:LacI family transcriptional regulator